MQTQLTVTIIALLVEPVSTTLEILFVSVMLLAYNINMFPSFALGVTVSRKLPFKNVQLNVKLN